MTGAVVPALLLALSIVAAPARSQAQETADATALLHQAAATMAGLSSFHFELSTPRGQSLVLENLELVGIVGDVQRPDRFRATVRAKAAIVELTVKVVGIGTRLWITDPMAQEERYVEIDLATGTDGPGVSPADLLNPDRVLLAAVDLVDNPTVGEEDEIDGVETTRVDGTVDLSRVAGMGTPVPGLRLDDPFPISLWIDEAGRVHRLELDGPLTEAESPDVRRRLDLSAFDEPVDIQPPV